MKITWEAKDIKPGRRVRKPDCAETWMIGYDPSYEDRQAKYLVFSLNDGMVARKGMTPEQIATFMNDAGNHPVELLEPV